jgi:hypothetical protein
MNRHSMTLRAGLCAGLLLASSSFARVEAGETAAAVRKFVRVGR